LRRELRGIGPLAGTIVAFRYSGIEFGPDPAVTPTSAFDVETIGVNGPPLGEHGGADVRGDDPDWIDDSSPHIVEARDARTGMDLSDARVVYGLPGGVLSIDFTGGTGLRLSRGSRPIFSVWAKGHRPAFGDDASFSLRDDKRVAEVALEPGVGAVLHFRTRDELANDHVGLAPPGSEHWLVGLLCAPPLPGVEVEGALGGALYSDEAGMMRITAPKECTLTLRAKGWRLSQIERVTGEANIWIVWMQSMARFTMGRE
jgi:hypothetical protein